MSEPIIDQFMTESPYTIGRDQPLSVAGALMAEHAIRHLPVLYRGRLVGVLSQRDVAVVSGLPRVDAAKISVSEAMSEDVFTVGRRSTLRKVAAQMAEHKYGCAVVLEKERVVGVFTTVDALEALADLLEP